MFGQSHESIVLFLTLFYPFSEIAWFLFHSLSQMENFYKYRGKSAIALFEKLGCKGDRIFMKTATKRIQNRRIRYDREVDAL
jgi:hypothetical protein